MDAKTFGDSLDCGAKWGRPGHGRNVKRRRNERCFGSTTVRLSKLFTQTVTCLSSQDESCLQQARQKLGLEKTQEFT
jgi:hypothetical protein